jgi:hypothetical protein
MMCYRAEQTVEDYAWIDFHRQRRQRSPPAKRIQKRAVDTAFASAHGSRDVFGGEGAQRERQSAHDVDPGPERLDRCRKPEAMTKTRIGPASGYVKFARIVL